MHGQPHIRFKMLHSMTSTIYKDLYGHIWRPKSKNVWDRCTTLYSDMFENLRFSVFSRGRFIELSDSTLSCLFVLEMFPVLITVCRQMAAAGLLHISEITSRGLNISFKRRFTTTHFLVFINFSGTDTFQNLYILGPFAEFRKTTISFIMSVCPFTWKISTPTFRILREILYSRI